MPLDYGFENILLITPIHIELNLLYLTRALAQDITMHSTFCIPVTLTLTSESVFRFRNLPLGFENCSFPVTLTFTSDPFKPATFVVFWQLLFYLRNVALLNTYHLI